MHRQTLDQLHNLQLLSKSTLVTLELAVHLSLPFKPCHPNHSLAGHTPFNTQEWVKSHSQRKNGSGEVPFPFSSSAPKCWCIVCFQVIMLEDYIPQCANNLLVTWMLIRQLLLHVDQQEQAVLEFTICKDILNSQSVYMPKHDFKMLELKWISTSPDYFSTWRKVVWVRDQNGVQPAGKTSLCYKSFLVC